LKEEKKEGCTRGEAATKKGMPVVVVKIGRQYYGKKRVGTARERKISLLM